MKPFLCTDITNDKKNKIQNGQELIVEHNCKYDEKEITDKQYKYQNVKKKNSLPLWLVITDIITSSVLFAIMAGIAKSGLPVKEAFANAPEVFYIAGALFILCLMINVVMYFYKDKLAKQHGGEKVVEKAWYYFEDAKRKVMEDFDIPKDAFDIDIIFFNYAVEGKKITPKRKTVTKPLYTFLPFKIFVQGDVLYIADMAKKYAINKNSLKCIKMYDKIITATMGDKNEYINRQLPRGMGYDDFNVSIYRYHILEFVVNNQTYGIYYPAAFNDVVEQLTGLTSKEAPESKTPWKYN